MQMVIFPVKAMNFIQMISDASLQHRRITLEQRHRVTAWKWGKE